MKTKTIKLHPISSRVIFCGPHKKSLRKLCLQDADLQDADLRGADLRGADLQDARLGGADLRGADLQDADLQDADLRGTDLQGADLRGTDLQGARLRRADLRGTDLQGADLRGADLQDARLGGADLQGADLQDADLQDADLQNVDLRGAKFHNADTSGAIIEFSQKTWMNNNFFKSTDGYFIVYKTISDKTPYEIPTYWQIKPWSVIKENLCYDRSVECGCGVNFGTLKWCLDVYNDRENTWECRLNLEDIADLCVPYGSKGNARCGSLILISKINNDQH